jgi:hypothetical protein
MDFEKLAKRAFYVVYFLRPRALTSAIRDAEIDQFVASFGGLNGI